MKKLYVVASLVGLIPLLVIIYLLNQYVFPQITDESVGAVLVITGVVLLTIIIALGGYMIIRVLMCSLARTLDQAVSIAGGDFSQRISMEGDGEINKLAKSFNRITDELEKKIDEVTRSKKQLQTFLFRIGTALSVKHDIDDLLAMVVDTTTQALEARQGVLMLTTGDGKCLKLRKTCGYTPGMPTPREIKIGEGIEGKVAGQNQPYLDGDRVLCVPLTVSEKTIGTLSVYEKEGCAGFTEDDLEVLGDIAAQVALALENSRLKVDQQQLFFETLTALASAVEARDPYTRGHSRRVQKYSELLARKISPSDSKLACTVRYAALVHDIGKISFPDKILKSPETLGASEREMIKQHPLIAVKILEPLTSFRDVLDPVRHHHEKYDGTGYPDGVSGNELSLAARIIQVADTLDAMFSDRNYSVSKNLERGLDELRKGKGTQFDPEIAQAAIEMLTEAQHAQSIIPADEKTAKAILLLLASGGDNMPAGIDGAEQN